ncbi:MAG: hypothetical protein BWX70_00168 [Verrucomicrobia bacterium ADurb.Bin070]|nr:MAG: hypothetical protein BWX70_00168 [Verrucomicrobia bacterium ADurb.Bin070]
MVLVHEPVDLLPLPARRRLERRNQARALLRIARFEAPVQGFPQRVDGLFAHSAEHAEQPPESHAVRAVLADPQEGDDILDVRLLEHADAGGDYKRQARAPEHHLQLDRVEVRPVKHRHVAQGIAVLLIPPDHSQHRARLLVAVAQEKDLRLVARLARGTQRLLELFGVALDTGVRHSQHLRHAAVIAFQLDDPATVPALRELHDVLEVRAAPRVDALKIVAHGHHVAAEPAQDVHHASLQQIGVLILVNQHMPEAVLIKVAHRFVLDQ